LTALRRRERIEVAQRERIIQRFSLFLASLGIAVLAFAGPANATQVSCGDTITQSTTLDGDVVCTNGQDTGLFIGAGNLTLDLAGHAVRAVPPSRGIGISTKPLPGTRFQGLRITGGRIEGFRLGVYLLASDSSVRRLTIPDGSGGISLDGDRNGVIRNAVEPTPGTVSDGVAVLGVDAYVAGNTVRGARTGISTYGNNPRIVVNTVEHCTQRGIVAASYTSAAVVATNHVTGCSTWQSAGVFVKSEYGSPGGASVRRNIATGNYTGLAVIDPAAQVLYNTANSNAQTGIYIDHAGDVLTGNTANFNGYYGISAPPGTIDGGGNTATGNGEVDCTNVSCNQ
jgi:parallel beta-helix repeat protein